MATEHPKVVTLHVAGGQILLQVDVLLAQLSSQTNAEARCDGSWLTASRKYSLRIDIKPPATTPVEQRGKSDYMKVVRGTVLWKDPFGESL